MRIYKWSIWRTTRHFNRLLQKTIHQSVNTHFSSSCTQLCIHSFQSAFRRNFMPTYSGQRLRLRQYLPTCPNSFITCKTTTWSITYMKTLKLKLFLLFQLPEERRKAVTSVPGSTPDAAWDRHLLDWICHQTWWSATFAFCCYGSYLVSIFTARCNSTDFAVRHHYVSGAVCHLQENHVYLYRKYI
jgi:hypothetical protein